jgi:hypothetical protein
MGVWVEWDRWFDVVKETKDCSPRLLLGAGGLLLGSVNVKTIPS